MYFSVQRLISISGTSGCFSQLWIEKKTKRWMPMAWAHCIKATLPSQSTCSTIRSLLRRDIHYSVQSPHHTQINLDRLNGTFRADMQHMLMPVISWRWNLQCTALRAIIESEETHCSDGLLRSSCCTIYHGVNSNKRSWECLGLAQVPLSSDYPTRPQQNIFISIHVHTTLTGKRYQ